MKKIVIMLLALSMAAALAACGNAGGETAETQEETAGGQPAAEEFGPEDEYAGAWYGLVGGMEMVLDLNSDGRYIITFAGGEENGSWRLSDEGIVLDADETATLTVQGEQLFWPGSNVYFNREVQAAGAYSPAELLTDVDSEVFNGYWRSRFVETAGAILTAESVNEVTDVYIEAPRAALGGPLFGDVVVDMTAENGALVFSEGDVSVTLALQEDGFLRMTLENGDEEMVLYLALSGPGEEAESGS